MLCQLLSIVPTAMQGFSRGRRLGLRPREKPCIAIGMMRSRKHDFLDSAGHLFLNVLSGIVQINKL